MAGSVKEVAVPKNGGGVLLTRGDSPEAPELKELSEVDTYFTARPVNRFDVVPSVLTSVKKRAKTSVFGAFPATGDATGPTSKCSPCPALYPQSACMPPFSPAPFPPFIAALWARNGP